MAPTEFTVLVVDDEEGLRDLLKDGFEMLGAAVQVAANGKQAFEIVKTTRFDFVLSDVRMPGGDGIELFQDIQTLPEPRPMFFLMSGYSDLNREQALARGIKDLFQKPFDFSVVFNVLAAHRTK